MERFNANGRWLPIAVLCLWCVGCSESNNEKPVARAPAELEQEAQTRVVLEDGVYPVVSAAGIPAEQPAPGGDAESKIVELINIPVEGSGDSSTDKIRVISKPLLRFRNVPHFDFKFENSECTEVGFQNTDELKAYTRNHVGARLAVVIDNQVVSHHKIREAIESDEVRITCCTVGGGDHLHKHLKQLKLASDASEQSEGDH
jgi:hypothetical protein